MSAHANRKIANRDSGRKAESTATAEPSQFRIPVWAYAVALFLALNVAFLLYGPALDGPFLFDDFGLPFYSRTFAQQPLIHWLAGVRPILMLSYWINFQMSARDPWTYHAFGILLHTAISALLFVLFLRLLRLRSVDNRRALLCAGIASCLFLVHPLQSEAVAYIAGRSELVAGLFAVAALVVYSNPKLTTVTWKTAGLVLFLYCCAVLSKEQAVVLPALLLAIDVLLRGRTFRETLRLGARLYYTIAVAGLIGVAGIIALLARSTTAGFNVPGIQWYEYLFTQFRMWFLYLRLAVFPWAQNADYDIQVSRTFLEHGSAIALLCTIAIAAAAWHFRKRFPLAVFGLLMFAVFLAPTSSVIPIQDLAAERRMYLPLVGLLLVLTELLLRSKLSVGVTTALFTVMLIFSALTHDRAKVWGSDIAFWTDTVAQSPEKARGYTHLAVAYVKVRRCSEVVNIAGRIPDRIRNTPEFLGMLGHAYACDHRMNEAVKAFEQAVQVAPSVGRYLALANIYHQVGKEADAQKAEEEALKIPPRTAYDYTLLENFQRTREQSRSRSAPRS